MANLHNQHFLVTEQTWGHSFHKLFFALKN